MSTFATAQGLPRFRVAILRCALGTLGGILLILLGSTVLSCSAGGPTPPLALTADKRTLEANGLDRVTLSAIVGGDAVGVVVSFTSTGGLLSSSAAVPRDGVARVTLYADREEALLGRADKPVTVRATVTRDVQDVDTATLDLKFIAPTTGAPSLWLVATPEAVRADGNSAVIIELRARRLAAGTRVAVSSSAGTLSSTELLLEDDGAGGVSGQVRLTAPTTPQDAIVVAREPSGVSAQIIVRFVRDGDAQFDLTGTFAQRSPARIRMTAGTLTPNPQCVVAPAIVKVEMVQTDDRIDAVYTTCHVTLVPVRSIVGEVTNQAPPAFLSAIPQVHASFALSSLALGAVFDPPPSVVVSGAALDDPDNDALPVDENDPRVRDSDRDGRPGVTVINSIVGEQNVTFRNKGDTRGVVQSSNRIVGLTPGDLTALPQSSVLGAGNGFIPEMEGIGSVFEVVRVDGENGSPDMDTNGDGDLSCVEIVYAQDFLFSVDAPDTPIDCAGVSG